MTAVPHDHVHCLVEAFFGRGMVCSLESYSKRETNHHPCSPLAPDSYKGMWPPVDPQRGTNIRVKRVICVYIC